LRAVVIRR